MELTFNEVNAITSTLPIGLYANRRIVAELGHDETSWYNPQDDVVLISYEQVTKGLTHYNGNPETLIRSNFYHEISHAILTPKTMNCDYIYNVFEDERIETLLHNYYFNVDFKNSIYAINGHTKDNVPPITNMKQAFYYLVRFRISPNKELLKEVDELIYKWRNLNRNRTYIWAYENDIENLWQKLAKSLNAPTDLPCDNGDVLESGQGQGDLIQVDPNSLVQSDTLTEDFEKLFSENEFSTTVQELISDSLNYEFDSDIFNALSIIFEQFRKKNSKGSSINGYSGIFNPRAVQRTDYKYFERPSTIRGNNSFGTFHLNLFVDVSSSFHNNTKKTNQIIKALCLIEKKNPNFSLDVITTNEYTEIRPKNKRFIKCDGGTYLGKQIEDIYRKMQLPNTYNYNIVLFDGDAYYSPPWERSLHYNTKGQGFSIFSPNNTTIISDMDNYKYITKFAPKTRTIYTTNFTEELFGNILSTITKALN